MSSYLCTVAQWCSGAVTAYLLSASHNLIAAVGQYLEYLIAAAPVRPEIGHHGGCHVPPFQATDKTKEVVVVDTHGPSHTQQGPAMLLTFLPPTYTQVKLLAKVIMATMYFLVGGTEFHSGRRSATKLSSV